MSDMIDLEPASPAPSFLKSPAIDKVAEALAAAQGEMGVAREDSTNPHFKSKYADFSSHVDASRRVLAKHGLAVSQPTRVEGGQLFLDTVLLHKSGQFFGSTFPVLIPNNATMQQVGSAITYARRYAYSSLVGTVSGEDDDGNASAGTIKSQPAYRPPVEAAKPETPFNPDNPKHYGRLEETVTTGTVRVPVEIKADVMAELANRLRDLPGTQVRITAMNLLKEWEGKEWKLAAFKKNPPSGAGPSAN